MMGESVDLGDDPSVHRLMEFLKKAFHPRHYDDVGEILTTREKKWKDETELLKEEIGRLRSDKLALEAKLKHLQELIARVNGDRTAIQERERGMLEEVHKREAEVTELRTETIELKNNKSKAEAATAQWKKRFEDSESEMIEVKNSKSKAEAATAQWKKRFEDLELEMIEVKNNNSKREADVTELRTETIEVKNNKSKAEAATAQWKKRFEDLESEMIEVKNNKSKAEAATAQWKKRFEDLGSEMIEVKNNKSKAEAASAQWKKRFWDLESEMIEVKNNKSKAEVAATQWKKSYEDLEARISQLEIEAELLLRGMGSSILKNIEEGLDGNCTLKKHVKTEADVFDCNEAPSQVREDSLRDAGIKGDVHHVVETSDSDNDDCEKTQISSEKSPHSNWDDTKSGSFALKRKSQAENCCSKDNTQPSKQMCLGKMRWHESQMSMKRTPKCCRSKFVFGAVHGDSVESDSSSDSDSDQPVDECISDVKSCRKWKNQIDMFLALDEDPELCMDAVCALYRQKILLKDGGLFKYDAVRGSELAEFLIDGDEDGKRRKSKEDLMEHDKNGIKDCLKIASISYAQQLFNIFKNQEDPLFP